MAAEVLEVSDGGGDPYGTVAEEVARREAENRARSDLEESENVDLVLYYDKNVIDASVGDYENLLNTMTEWAARSDREIEVLTTNAGGEAVYAEKSSYDCNQAHYYLVMYNKVLKARDIMISSIEYANKLLLMCEGFYTVLTSGASGYYSYASYACGTPMTSQLLYINTYFGETGGVMADATEAIMQDKGLVEQDVDDIETCLSKLTMTSVDISGEISEIEDNCRLLNNIDALLEVFAQYVREVNYFNEHYLEEFLAISELDFAYDYSRSYEYPSYTMHDRTLLLERMCYVQLREMGFTDEEIQNAINKSSFTLQELLLTADVLLFEGINNYNGDEEILLFRAILSGNTKDGLSKYGDDLKQNASFCWVAIGDYMNGLTHVDCSKTDRMIKDDGYTEYLDILNQILSIEGSDTYFTLIAAGTWQTVQDASQYATNILIANEYDYDDPAFKQAYAEYAKALMLYNSYIYFAEIDDIGYSSTGVGQGNGCSCSMTYEDKITSISMTEEGLVFEIESTDTYTERVNGEVSESSVDKYNCYMEIDIKNSLDEQDRSNENKRQQDEIVDATNAKNKAVRDLIKDAIVAGGMGAGYLAAGPAGSAVGAFLGNVAAATIDIGAGSTESGAESLAKTIIEAGVKGGTGSKGAASAAKNAVAIGYDIYDIVNSYSEMDDAEKMVAKENRANMTGSSTECTFTSEKSEESTIYVVHNDDVYNPLFAKGEAAIENGGLQELCGLTDGEKNAILENLGDSKNKAYCEALLNGKVVIDENTNYSELLKALECINDAANKAEEGKPKDTRKEENYVMYAYEGAQNGEY